MTDIDVDGLRKLLAAATPGPLKAVKGADPYSDDPNRWAVWRADDAAPHSPEYLVAIIENGSPGDTMDTEGHTANLFAQLFNAAPTLLDMAEKCERYKAALEEELRILRDGTRRSTHRENCHVYHPRCAAIRRIGYALEAPQ